MRFCIFVFLACTLTAQDRRVESYLMEQASGTSMNPRSATMPMLMFAPDGWQIMLMGTGFLVDTQQSGPRGADKLFSTNWVMVGATHRLGRGAFMFQSMNSLEPATVTRRRYPELFQTGETAYGAPLVDAQHPHDFFMSLGAQYAYPLSEHTILQAYAAPVGDPALGPVAFPHRASAQNLPQATLGHHWEDATHIADDVVTVALMHRAVRVEASGFHGAEPDEHRWNIDYGPIDSWSARVSVFASKDWMAQVSAGRLTHPEPTDPGDVTRITASLHYTRPLASGSAWSSSLIWGRNHVTSTGRNLNAYLAETVFPIGRRNSITGRAELVDKDELFEDEPAAGALADQHAGAVFRIQAYTAGYTREIANVRYADVALGANATAYGVPAAIHPYYGTHPFAVNMYLRVRLGSPSHHASTDMHAMPGMNHTNMNHMH